MATSREVKVGAFVLVALSVIGGVVFLIGDERQAFRRHVPYGAEFKDVNGLRRGSTVRMGGVDIGSVKEIGYGQNEKDATIYVELSVASDEARRIRADSEATIESKGLLGDKMLVVTVGSDSQPQVPPGTKIKSKESKAVEELMADVKKISERTQKVVENLEKTTNTLADDQFQEDIKQSLSSLNSILRSVDQGDGYAAKILHDPNEAARLSKTIANLENATARLDTTLGSVQQIVDRVKTGPGLAHEVLYGEESSKAVAQFGGAAEEITKTLQGVREGKGIAHSVLYGDEGSNQVLSNLNEMSADLRQIVADVKSGKGTVGALLVDPSVYEDVKMLLGNVGRNRSLRALVRYSIQKDEGSAPVVDKVDPPARPAAGVDSARVEPDGSRTTSGSVGTP
jgi:phospholipid/cholesterol/gamma-HCH transport system substrate-binding protein